MTNFSVAFTPEAEIEALRAYFWYENQRVGLGEDFKKCLDSKIESLIKNPKTSSYIEQNLKAFLDKKVDEYDQPSFIKNDPICIPHSFSKKEDIEIAGFFAAIFAWGNRTTII